MLFAIPASAYIANSSSVITSYTDTQFANQNYIPYQYEFLFIVLGLVCWAFMKYNAELEVLFGLLAAILFGMSAYLAAYISIDDAITVIDGTTGETTILYTQLVTPQPMLQIFLTVCFLFAIIIEIYILFLRTSDKTVDAEGTGRRGFR
jgi:hypothetical protein